MFRCQALGDLGHEQQRWASGADGAVACEFKQSCRLAVFLPTRQIAKKERVPDSCFVFVLRSGRAYVRNI
ncbi:hypothetical protein CUJ84_Chr002444 [Rhizobium leguminosarum]|uniref:Uncharacterized protein n=1 Tax=Rhizobium leguminosarum TaxID=384 RepID=A0A2K9Z3G7_RHILE|nr:hypothetical protein CUJ84_Chr002444 [Rhizobium leguminosarum]